MKSQTIQNGYDYILDDETGTFKAISRSTGEITEAVQHILPYGTKCYTPESQRLYKERKEQERKHNIRRLKEKELGNFYFTSRKEDFTDISPESLTRLIYLNTFIAYGNRVMLTERTPMHHRDLSGVLKLSKATITRFWKEVSPKYIKETDEGLILSNDVIFRRGAIKEGDSYQRMYIKGIRSLYESTDKCNHKYLGFLFRLLPFVNIEYNVVCSNPFEKDLERVELISIADFCNMIGYDKAHINKLIRIYQNIKFDIGEKLERFCSFTYDGISRQNAKIFINPHILYCGSDYTKVEVLGAFCK